MLNAPPSSVAITGATGLIGSALADALASDGIRVRRLVRAQRQQRADDVLWDPARGQIDSAALDGVDAVVHLAGEPIGQRWTPAVRRRIRESRIDGTRLIATAIASLGRPPRVLVSGSAEGIYGSRGDEVLDETSAIGSDFLARLAADWEAEADRAAAAGLRVVKIRTGLVLSPRGGALARLLLPFRLGLGGRVGSGRQWVSWIALGDTVRAIRHLIEDDAFAGPANLSAPNPVRNAELVATLGKVLHRPTILPIPATALRALFGEMGDATLLASQRMYPRRLLEAGFQFSWPTLESALRHELSR